MATAVTLFHMASKGGCPALFNRGHDASLRPRERGLVRLPKRRAIALEDIRHFKGGATHGVSSSPVGKRSKGLGVAWSFCELRCI